VLVGGVREATIPSNHAGFSLQPDPISGPTSGARNRTRRDAQADLLLANLRISERPDTRSAS
jgi:hypothetical protein